MKIIVGAALFPALSVLIDMNRQLLLLPKGITPNLWFRYAEAIFKSFILSNTNVMNIHNKNALFLSFSGGMLMIISGASGAIAVLDELGEALTAIFGRSIVFTFDAVMGYLAVMTIIAGIVTIIGGVILTTDRVWLGRVILLGAIAAGVLGLMITMVQLIMTGTLNMGITLQLQQSMGWVGAIIAFVARIIADQKPLVSPTA